MKFMFLVLLIMSCSDNHNSNINDNAEVLPIEEVRPNNKTLLDSIQLFSKVNSVKTFQIEKLQTDDFKNMIPVDKKLFNILYPERRNYTLNSYYVYAHIPQIRELYSFIIYQKNYEGENYRVDYMDLINLDTLGNKLNNIRLTAMDNALFIYEVNSFLNKDTLKILQSFTEPDNSMNEIDTLYIHNYTLKLFGVNGKIDTLDVGRKIELIGE